MSLYLDDGDLRLYHGDCLQVLRELPDGSVDMVATSPPFYGLRDYGTGTWEGGQCGCGMKFRDVRGVWMCIRCQKPRTCDHVPLARKPGSSTLAAKSHGGYSEKAETASRSRSQAFGATCGKCGARRVDQQIGLEETPDQWVDRLVGVFRECRRVLADHGTLWVEIGDSYAGGPPGGPGKQDTNKGSVGIPNRPHPTKPKDLLGQPWMLAFALRADGWFLRSEIIWARPNPMPESVTDRPTKAHSTVFLLSKRPRYFYDADAIREAFKEPERVASRYAEGFRAEKYGSRYVGQGTSPSNSDHRGGIGTLDGSNGEAPRGPDGRRQTAVTGRENSQQHRDGERWPNPSGANARSVWTIPTEPTPFAHFATWPQALVRRMILAGTSERGKCPECGKPWVRETESALEELRPPQISTAPTGYNQAANRIRDGHVPGVKRSATLGWSPSCACNATPVPCVVLDPFAGSGTTLLVARNHGRHAIGIELNEEYLQIAATRVQQLSLLAQPQAGAA